MKYFLALLVTISWLHSLSALQESEVKFQLWTRSTKDSAGQRLERGNTATLQSSGYKGSLPTVLCAHGWLGDMNKDPMQALKSAYLSYKECNYIIVDWSACAKKLSYATVVECVPQLGEIIKNFILFLVNSGGASCSNIHCMGHSLGAHGAGIAGSSCAKSGCNVGRMTALDPAGPSYDNSDSRPQVGPSSAVSVDAIHTNCGGYGSTKAVGHKDFFANGGSQQPGCNGDQCSHMKAIEYLVNSLNNPSRYLGNRCANAKDATSNKNCNGGSSYMGIAANQSGPNGSYFVPIS